MTRPNKNALRMFSVGSPKGPGTCRRLPVMIKTGSLVTGVVSASLGAAEVSLYDCDYTASSALLGQPIPLSTAPMPGRTACGEIVFGSVVIGSAPSPWTGTAAMMRPAATGSFHYSQMEFIMLSGSVYAFRKHRIETTFRFPTSVAGEGLTIFTDGGVTSSLSFGSSGGVGLYSNVMEYGGPWGDRVVSQYQALPSFDPAQPVHLVWETDIDGGKTTVTINGNSTTVSGLSPQASGSRNWSLYPGPLFVRINFASSGTTHHLALRSFRITGDDYDGPAFTTTEEAVTENDVVTIPFDAPASGSWQPQFSTDGKQWKNFATTITAANPFTAVSFGKRAAPTMFFRLGRVEP